MDKYLCTLCGYIYDPNENEKIKFEDLEDDWVCPVCQAEKNYFEIIE